MTSPAAVAGLRRSDPRGPGIIRPPGDGGFRYADPAGAPLTDAATLARIAGLAIPPPALVPAVRSLARSDNGLDALFAWQRAGAWHVLHSHDVNDYIATRSGGHYTATEFRTWNATVLMALLLAAAAPAATDRQRTRSWRLAVAALLAAR